MLQAHVHADCSNRYAHRMGHARSLEGEARIAHHSAGSEDARPGAGEVGLGTIVISDTSPPLLCAAWGGSRIM